MAILPPLPSDRSPAAPLAAAGRAAARSRQLQHIVMLASALEPDPDSVREWLHATPIVPLDSRTALELANAGQGAKVIALLQRALDSEQREP